jgi:hypothetical protein
MNGILAAMLGTWTAAHTPEAGARFANDPKADELVKADLMAFLLAASLDRGGTSFELWNLPHLLAQSWGHLDPARIEMMAQEALAQEPAIAHAPSQVSRLQLARTIVSLATVIQQECGGDPERMLEGSVSEIMERLQLVNGIGPNIARMIIIQRMLYFGLEPEMRGRLLPKLDVHVQRVLERTGVVSGATEENVRRALSDLSMREVAIVDQVCWDVGQRYCRPHDPKCHECLLARRCPRTGVS